MANERQLKRLRKGARYWNRWRERSPVEVNLAEAKRGVTVAVKVTDMTGAEMLVVIQM